MSMGEMTGRDDDNSSPAIPAQGFPTHRAAETMLNSFTRQDSKSEKLPMQVQICLDLSASTQLELHLASATQAN